MPTTTELTLGDKLDQRRFTHMSDKMAALVAYTLGKQSNMDTDPSIIQLSITCDGIVVANNSDMTSTIIGSAEDFFANWEKLMASAGDLTPAEEKLIRSRLARIPDWRS